MVRNINYKKRVAESKEFFLLEVFGGIEMVLSKTTGMYFTVESKENYMSFADDGLL